MSALLQLGHKASAPPDYSDPVGFLAGCHRRIEARLATLPRIVDVLRAGDPAHLAEARDALRAFVKHFDDAAHKHTLDEEVSVFPRVPPEAYAELPGEHREHEAIYLAVRTVALRLCEHPPDAATIDELDVHGRAMSAVYKEHIAKEEAMLFPAMRALDEKELRAIGLEMRLRRG
jgi:hemerythrin-like domain-containing protein